MKRTGLRTGIAIASIALIASAIQPANAAPISTAKAKKPTAPQIASVTETPAKSKGKKKFANVVVAIEAPAAGVSRTRVSAKGTKGCTIKAPKTSCTIKSVSVGKKLSVTAKSKSTRSGYGAKSTKATYRVGNVNSVAVLPTRDTPVTATGVPITQGTINQVGAITRPDMGAPTTTSESTPETNTYWTEDRVGKASTREIIFDEEIVVVGKGKNKKNIPVASKTARIKTEPRGKPKREANSTGQPWNSGGLPLAATGKVFFTFGSSTYVCSGSVVTDTATDRSIVLTAAHCAYNQATQQFATNWTFIPAYDSKPNGSCTDVSNLFPYGCWTASALVVHSKFANQTAFNADATQSDWAFGVFAAGASGAQLDATVGSFPLNESGFTAIGNPSYSFGYPAASPYGGADLIFCNGNISTDEKNSNKTWGLGCNMTGGASGGPWMSAFSTSNNSGALSSVNSYKYSTDSSKMYGPMFDSQTRSTFNWALTAASNAKVS
jgi:hypothetical protein